MRKPLLLALFAVSFYTFSNTQLAPVEGPVTVAPVMKTAEVVETHNTSRLTRRNFEMVVRSLYDSIGLADYGLAFHIFEKAMTGFYTLTSQDAVPQKHLLTIIDFEKASTEKRFYTIDLANQMVKYHTYVAHGRNTGENNAVDFSNTPHSNQSSLGFFVTAETYYGSKGYSLRLDGMEKQFNDKVRSRAVVIHGADYVSESWIKRYGRLGRSQGCPALPQDLNRKVIDEIKEGTAIFAYFPEETYLTSSHFLNTENLFRALDEQPIELATAFYSDLRRS